MSERLADINSRVEGIRQLGAVVNAMRGIAAARAQQARSQLAAVDSYAGAIAGAIGRTLDLAPAGRSVAMRGTARPAVVVFLAEQGFAGSFTERVLDSITAGLPAPERLLIGTRGCAIARERGLAASWESAMPSHTLGVPRLADRISEALYARIAAGAIDRLDAVFCRWLPNDGIRVERRRLFPLDPSGFTRSTEPNPPLTNLSPEALLTGLTADYLHAQLCNAALHAFASENEARMEVMASAHDQIERHLSALRSTQRVVRQEEITAEIIELAAGESANRPSPRGDRIG